MRMRYMSGLRTLGRCQWLKKRKTNIYYRILEFCSSCNVDGDGKDT